MKVVALIIVSAIAELLVLVRCAHAASPTLSPTPTPIPTPPASAKLTLRANTEEDLAGYRIYAFRFSDGHYKGLIDVGNKPEIVLAATAYNRAGQESPATIATVLTPPANPRPTPHPVLSVIITPPKRAGDPTWFWWPAALAADRVTQYLLVERIGTAEEKRLTTQTNTAGIVVSPGVHLYVVVAVNANGQSVRTFSFGFRLPEFK